jgi:hypothetical protein
MSGVTGAGSVSRIVGPLRMSKKSHIVISCVAALLITLAIIFRLLNPPIEVHGSLSAADLVKIQQLVSRCQSAPLYPLSMNAVRQRFFQPIQCVYATPDGLVQVVCRVRKHAYDGYSHHYEFIRDGREPSGWRLCGQGSGYRGYGFL